MWPRTPEERVRNRHTGFVCFMNRQDAEDAMDACNEQDPFRVGRQLMMRWGKNVRKRDGGVPIISRGTSGLMPLPVATAPETDNQVAALALRSVLHPIDAKKAIHVVMPKDRDRANLISTVASFVAKDGSQFEQILLQQEGNNAHLNFLSMPTSHSPDSYVEKEEYIFYKWRVYAFCQGDGFSTWRTEPFMMLQPNGCMWYPPPIDVEAAQREANDMKRKEDTIRSLKDERRYHNTKRNIVTGRQLEQQRKKSLHGLSAELSEQEMTEFDKLFKQELCVSRESICQAMAFCFEKSNAAKHISVMIQDLLMQLSPSISIETLSARIYLISDILYNSQQPGIRNAFLYRDAIERMSPELFYFLGDFVRTNFGRLSQERVASTVTLVFSAWSNWGVFDPTFINDLAARFEGRMITQNEQDIKAPQKQGENVVMAEVLVDDAIIAPTIDEEKPKGDWTSIHVHNESVNDDEHNSPNQNGTEKRLVREPCDDDDPDGEPLEDDLDGAPLDIAIEYTQKAVDNDSIDGEMYDDDVDGAPL
jgi:U2-associated protein SR140